MILGLCAAHRSGATFPKENLFALWRRGLGASIGACITTQTEEAPAMDTHRTGTSGTKRGVSSGRSTSSSGDLAPAWRWPLTGDYRQSTSVRSDGRVSGQALRPIGAWSPDLNGHVAGGGVRGRLNSASELRCMSSRCATPSAPSCRPRRRRRADASQRVGEWGRYGSRRRTATFPRPRCNRKDVPAEPWRPFEWA